MLNNAVIMGRLVADPELRTTGSGISVSSFTVAVDRRFNRQGEDRQADFIDILKAPPSGLWPRCIRGKE